MKSEWTIMPLSEIINFNPTYSIKKGTFIPYVEMAAVPENTREIAYFENREFSSGSKFKNGDTLFSRITPCLQNGKTARVSGLKESQIGNGSTEFIVMSAKDIDDKDFVYYLALDKEFRNYAEGRMEGTTGRQRVSWQALSEYEFLIPPKHVRQKIAHILSTLDDKIELNRKMNQTLEEMASAIFKSWFVDFDPVIAKANCEGEAELENIAKELGISKAILDLFPNEFEESELGMIPKGWEVKTIDKISSVHIGKTPPRKEPQWFTTNPNDIKWVSIKDMGENGTYLLDTNEYLTEDAIKKYNVKTIPVNTVLLSFKLTLGRLSITSEEMTSNEAIAHFKIEKNSTLTSEFIYCYLKNFDYNQLGSTSSIATAINSQIVKTIPILIPNKVFVDKFQNTISPLFQKILNNSLEIRELQKTRDTLLPKLLSGEIDVSDLSLEME